MCFSLWIIYTSIKIKEKAGYEKKITRCGFSLPNCQNICWYFHVLESVIYFSYTWLLWVPSLTWVLSISLWFNSFVRANLWKVYCITSFLKTFQLNQSLLSPSYLYKNKIYASNGVYLRYCPIYHVVKWSNRVVNDKVSFICIIFLLSIKYNIHPSY